MINAQYFTNLLNKNQPFSLVRYGDGEWNAILGAAVGSNVDGQNYGMPLTSDLRDSLTAVFPNHYFALNPIARLCGQDRIDETLKELAVKINWVNGDMFLDASISGKLGPFVNALRSNHVLYVGPNRLQDFICQTFPGSGYIPVPVRNSYDVWRETTLAILNDVSNYNVVAFSNGMATNVIIPELRRRGVNRTTLIDLGSLWEGYIQGGAKRSHAAKLTQRNIERNLKA